MRAGPHTIWHLRKRAARLTLVALAAACSLSATAQGAELPAPATPADATALGPAAAMTPAAVADTTTAAQTAVRQTAQTTVSPAQPAVDRSPRPPGLSPAPRSRRSRRPRAAFRAPPRRRLRPPSSTPPRSLPQRRPDAIATVAAPTVAGGPSLRAQAPRGRRRARRPRHTLRGALRTRPPTLPLPPRQHQVPPPGICPARAQRMTPRARTMARHRTADQLLHPSPRALASGGLRCWPQRSSWPDRPSSAACGSTEPSSDRPSSWPFSSALVSPSGLSHEPESLPADS